MYLPPADIMVEDIVRSFGFLTLGSRMKRIGERLQADTQRIIGDAGVAVQSGQFPFLASVDRLGPLTIGEIAEAVGITQPGATRVVSQLAALGLLKVRQAPKDQRRKIVTLTKKGRALVDQSKHDLWPRIENAVADLCGNLSGPLLKQLAAIEDGLAEKPLDRRVPPAAKRRR
jgi:DNA-binding MarR family transcriptional regulator